jgi:hypothetical protein
VIAQNYNPRFGMLRKEILVALQHQDAHSRDCLWCAFFVKGTIFSQSDFTVRAEGLKTSLFFLVALQPDFMIRMCIGQSFEQCRRTLAMKVQSTDKGCNQIKRQREWRNWRMDEQVGNMTRKKDAFNTQILPFGWKIPQGHAPILWTFVDMRFVNRTVDAIPLSQKTFMVLALMFKSDL